MKLSILALLVGAAAAYTTPTMTFAVGKKKVEKAVKRQVKSAVKKIVRQFIIFIHLVVICRNSIKGSIISTILTA